MKPLPIDFEKEADVATPDIFGRLISMKVHEISSLYSEEKASLSRSIISQKEEKDAQLDQFMTALQVDQLYLDNFDYLKLPKKLLECCASVSVRPKLVKEELPQLMKQIVDVSVQVKSQLDELEEMLQNEHNESRLEKKNNDESLSDLSDSQSDDEEMYRRAGKSKPKRSPYKLKMKEILDRYDLLLKRYNDGNTNNTTLHEAFNKVCLFALAFRNFTTSTPNLDE